MRNLMELASHYHGAIRSADAGSWPSEEAAMRVIREKSHRHQGAVPHRLCYGAAPVLESAGAATTSLNGRTLPVPASLSGDARATFVYAEMAQSDAFFTRFVWSSMLSDAVCPGGILWSRSVSELGLFTAPETKVHCKHEVSS